MLTSRSVVLLLIALGTLVLWARPAKGACLSLVEGSVHCNAPCNSFPIYVCATGCVPSFCTTGYGVCCGTHYSSNGLARDPNDDCSGFNCGEIRASPRSGKAGGAGSPDFKGASGGLGNPTEVVQVKGDSGPQEILFVPDRCSHTYSLVDPRVLPRGNGGI
jgi:hypothetical protein